MCEYPWKVPHQDAVMTSPSARLVTEAVRECAMQSPEGDSRTHREEATASLAPAASSNLPIVLSAPRKKSETISSPLASCPAKVGMVHTKSDARKNSFELSVTECVSTLRGHRHTCCVRLPRVSSSCASPSSMVLRVCVSVCVCLRLRACGRVCLSVLQDEILEVLDV